MPEGFGVVLLILFILFLLIGRAITMWYTGTGEIVKTQKQIIALLTDSLEAQREIIAMERNRRLPTNTATNSLVERQHSSVQNYPQGS